MAKAQVQEPISFAPETFSSGRWDGGRGTVVADPPPRFEYRVIKGSKGDFTVIESHFAIEDQESNQHDVKWQAGFADNIVIRESSDPDSDEAETGPSIFAREPGRKIQLRAQEEWAQLLASLQTQGYPSAKLNKGDLGVFVGLDADWVQFARKKDDKYPILVVGEMFDGKKGKAAASKPKASAAPAATAAKLAKPKPGTDDGADQDPTDADDDDATAEDVALAIAIEALNKVIEDAGDDEDDIAEARKLGTTVGDVSRVAYKKLKGDPKMRKEVMDLIGGDPDEKGAWIKSQSEFKYKAKSNSIVLVED